MLKIYFLTAFRSLLRNKSYSILNIAGLALGITCSILLFLVIRHETSYDTFHEKANRIYRIGMYHTIDGAETATQESLPVPVTDVLRNNNPGFEEITHVFGEQDGQITVPGEKGEEARHYRETGSVAFVEPQFFEMFSFETGNVDFLSKLDEPNNIVLTQSLADKYFPEADPIGKVVKFNNKLTLTVVAVIPDFPENTDFPFILLISRPTVKDFATYDIERWGTIMSAQNLYVSLPEGANEKAIEAKVNKIVMPHVPKESDDIKGFFLEPLRDIHFATDHNNYAQRTISREVVWGMALVGIFLIVTACINFINLATAQAIKRSKEVGMRKVLGSGYGEIVLQFLGETFLITLTATLLSVILTELSLPYLNDLLKLELEFKIISDPVILLFLISVVALVTMLAGLYPAFVLARYEPIAALKNKIQTQRVAGLSLRRALVVLQFTICQVLIICTLVVSEQMDYFSNKSLGFDKDAIVMLRLPVDEADKLMAYRQVLTNTAAVKGVSFAIAAPASEIITQNSFKFNNSQENMPFRSYTKYADEHYFNLFDIKFVAGRGYTKSDTAREFVINETMRRRLGIATPEEAIGMKIQLGPSGPFPIVGVVEDFHQSSLHSPIEPSIITPEQKAYYHMAAKINTGRTEEALKHLEETWYKAYPDHVFNYEFLDETFARFYSNEIRQSALFRIFSFIAILIGCIGLYGLIAFMAAQRTKEVGIRKVLGASLLNITYLFSKEFIKLVLVAFLIAVPIAFYLMNAWLQDFTYRIELSYGVFIIAGAVTMLIALVTMSVQAIKAAMADPVVSLKSE